MKRILVVDADTILHASAAQQQKNECNVIHKASGREKLFESKTLFNTWIKSQEKWSKDEFYCATVSTIVGEPRFAFQSIKQKVEKIVEAGGCDDFVVCIEGEGNFRKDYQTPYVRYKAQRTEKPLLFQECREFFIKKYKKRVILSEAKETDDTVNIMAWEGYNKALQTRKRSDSPYVVAYCDKDIKANSRGFLLNYNKLEDGIFWNDGLAQTNAYLTQCLIGDGADNIDGVLKLADITKQQYNIRVNGVGPATAEKILDGATTEKEMADRVVDVYQQAWPDDWEQRLQDNAFFLYLQRYEGEVFTWNKYYEGLTS
ncbi:MAG: putative ribonuclease H [Prokaryotic dsDNA virus sp.]|nr:MAG: putative ribonuclease H [Prokaryotic dsDNA virus sp.]|tara:strand:- start:56660 stop:57604 length:945 start_codon:yes stop_codon:yes gene_type:complete